MVFSTSRSWRSFSFSAIRPEALRTSAMLIASPQCKPGQSFNTRSTASERGSVIEIRREGNRTAAGERLCNLVQYPREPGVLLHIQGAAGNRDDRPGGIN